MALITFSVCSVGYLAEHGPRETLRFWVHSRFQHALNLSSASGELLTLLSPRYQNLPTAIRLETPAGWDWRHQSHSRQPITLENNVLRGALWRADLNRAPCWRPGADRTHSGNPLGGTPLIGVLAAYPALATQLSHYCRLREVRSNLQLLPDWPSGGRVPHLNLGDEKTALDRGVSELIGYGSGLTPDGDDYLLGYVAALWPWQHIDSVGTHLKQLRAAIKSQLHRTTGISRHYLGLALQGHYSEPVDHLTTILIRGSTAADIGRSATKVMEFGASSGVDCLGGFLHGMRTLEAVAQEETS